MQAPEQRHIDELHRLESLLDVGSGEVGRVEPSAIIGGAFDDRQEMYAWLRHVEARGLVQLEGLAPQVRFTLAGRERVQQAPGPDGRTGGCGAPPAGFTCWRGRISTLSRQSTASTHTDSLPARTAGLKAHGSRGRRSRAQLNSWIRSALSVGLLLTQAWHFACRRGYD